MLFQSLDFTELLVKRLDVLNSQNLVDLIGDRVAFDSIQELIA